MNEEQKSNLVEYYDLKSKYERRWRHARSKYLKNQKLSSGQKKYYISKLKRVCVNCKQEGGTIFSCNNSTLTAVCGNIQTPCKLNLQVHRGDYQNIRELQHELSEDVNTIRKSIIITKLNMLFNYVNEPKTVASFQELQSHLKTSMKVLDKLTSQYIDIVDNPQVLARIDSLKADNYETLNHMKEVIQRYQENPSEVLIQELVDLYINQVRPIVKDIQQLRYKENMIERGDDNQIRLKQQPFTIEDLLIDRSRI
tara:strand:- start:3194 stop:3955 length:762 start_codon:yes stop_codon:yes gene_type:complete